MRAQEAAQSYDALSRYYDLLTRSERAFQRRGLSLLAAEAGERVLDIGCGTGEALVDLAGATGPAGLAVGADLSAGMLAVAKEKRVARTGGQLALVRADALSAPFGSRVFDAVLLSFTLELFSAEDMFVLLAQVRRLLVNGGRLVVVSLSRHRSTPLRQAYEWMHAQWPAWIDCRPIDVERVLEEAGYRIQRLERESLWGLPVAMAKATY